MRISHPFTNTNLAHKITFLSTTLAILPLVAFLSLTLAPTPTETSVSATSETSEVNIGVNEVLSLRIVKYNESTGEWDIDTNEISTNVEHGSFATATVKVIASTNGTGGYTLSLSDTNAETSLTSPRTLTTIPTLSESKTLDNLTDTTEKFPAGKWGYSWAKNADPSLTFNPIPSFNASASEKQKDVTSEVGANIYTFTVGVRVAENTTAETYSDQVMFSLVGNPAPTAPLFYRTEYMQNFTPTICNTVKTPLASTTEVTADNGGDYMYSGDHATKVPSTTIKDQRDGQTYTIRKLADGNCWMTENLRIGKEGAVALDSTYSNLTAGRTFNLPAAKTIEEYNAKVAQDGKGWTWDNQAEYPFTFYRNDNENLGSSGTEGAPLNTVLYNWYTATAGALDSNGNSLMDAAGGNQAVDSVCPKNWQLPINEGDSGTGKSYSHLVRTYTGNGANRNGNTSGQTPALVQADLAKLHAAPTSFVYSVNYYYGGTLGFRSVGYWWSSTVSSATNSYYLHLDNHYSPYYVYPQNLNDKGYAFAVRCVAS